MSRVFAPDSNAEAHAFARFVKYPYPQGVRLDSVAAHPGPYLVLLFAGSADG